MKKFVFSLQKVLDVRELEEKKSMKKVAEAIDSHKKETQLLSQLQAEEKKAIRTIVGIQSKPVNAGVINILSNSLAGQYQRVINQQKRLLETHDKLKQCKDELVDMSKKKKILQRLKDSKLTKYKTGILKEDQKLTDETAGVISFRNSNDM